MSNRRADGRILIYSHDTMGLGHLRRCRTIAHSLVEKFKHVSVLILSGSPIIGSFDFRARVDFVRVPGVIKLRSGEYTSLNLHLDVEQTLKLRGSIIKHTAEMFEPDLFIVDKEPMGLRGEVLETLEMLKPRGTRLVLGLRDVLDEPRLLVPEWQRKNVLPALRDLYDEIWIYGLPQICDPLEGVSLPISVRQKMIYTGYLHREVPTHGAPPRMPEITNRPYLLVTTGGGGDGEALIEWVLRAYEHDPLLPYPALLVLGPFMQPERQAEFMDRAARLKRVDMITFHSHLETLVARAAGRGVDGRLQHLLRSPVDGQARAHRAAHRAAPGAVHPHFARRAAGPDLDAGRRRALRPDGDGRRAAPPAEPEPAVGDRGARPARRAGQRRPPGGAVDRTRRGGERRAPGDSAHRLN